MGNLEFVVYKTDDTDESTSQIAVCYSILVEHFSKYYKVEENGQPMSFIFVIPSFSNIFIYIFNKNGQKIKN